MLDRSSLPLDASPADDEGMVINTERGAPAALQPRAAALRGALGVAGGLATYGGALLADHAGLLCGT